MTGPGPLTPGASVGIDVVDLESPRVLRGLPRARTVERVLGEEEHRRVMTAPDPPSVFWALWAAKEAAFKAVTLLRGAPPVFSHTTFRVDLDTGAVRYGDIDLTFVLHRLPSRLVAVVRGGAGSDRESLVWGAGAIDALHRAADGLEVGTLRRERFSAAEADAVRTLSSALVRLAARKEAGAFLGVEESRVELVCPPGPAGRRPPYVVVDGRCPTDCGVSISHDGGWLAWAVAGTRADSGRIRAGEDGS